MKKINHKHTLTISTRDDKNYRGEVIGKITREECKKCVYWMERYEIIKVEFANK